jgi:hypothetical protein
MKDIKGIKELKYIKEQHSRKALSLGFGDDGSMIVKKGSTTIIKTGSSAFVKGGLIKDFKDDVVENIGLVQKSFST